ncbi:hypothetical protein EST38_g7757 [Candolleomyces aberdarensis]|uniref:Uncharacterized protein n=1 Tax=Candolleomyces aberdarensis TaxID=2316362 RepID=A0A4V1Q3C3_9AGAR|nr:hypothetical protein EST38_g7757 [Candolleomyces aberdarensis]
MDERRLKPLRIVTQQLEVYRRTYVQSQLEKVKEGEHQKSHKGEGGSGLGASIPSPRPPSYDSSNTLQRATGLEEEEEEEEEESGLRYLHVDTGIRRAIAQSEVVQEANARGEVKPPTSASLGLEYRGPSSVYRSTVCLAGQSTSSQHRNREREKDLHTHIPPLALLGGTSGAVVVVIRGGLAASKMTIGDADLYSSIPSHLSLLACTKLKALNLKNHRKATGTAEASSSPEPEAALAVTPTQLALSNPGDIAEEDMITYNEEYWIRCCWGGNG